jgi:hypothetical protein
MAPDPTDAPLPFRWNIAEEQRLGSLLAGERAASSADINITGRLLACCVRTLALAGNSDLVFIGRSPESLFDLLSGLLTVTSWRARLTLLHFSSGYSGELEKSRGGGPALDALRAYFDALHLSPSKLAVRERPVALIDLICSGNTLHQFLLLLRDWAKEEGVDWPAVRRKIRVVGIVRDGEDRAVPRWRRRFQPYSWRSQNPWLSEGELLEIRELHEVAIKGDLWEYLGDVQDKTTLSYGPDSWGASEYERPYHSETTLRALRFARYFFEAGRRPATRQSFVALLAQEPAFRQEWLRRLAYEIRSGG